MIVTEVDGISSILEMDQNRVTYRVEVAIANEHIDDTSGRLVIYVPKERREQELCFASVLPRKLAAWLMRDPNSSVEGIVEVEQIRALTSIFTSERSALDDVLDDQGILKVSFENEDEGYDDQDEDEAGDVEEEEEQQERQQPGNPYQSDNSSSEQQMTPTHSSVTPSSPRYGGASDAEPEGGLTGRVVEVISQQARMLQHSGRRGGDDPPQPAPYYQPSPPRNIPSYHAGPSWPPITPLHPGSGSSEDAQYRFVLERVVEAARRTAFPSRGAFDMSDLRDALPSSARNAPEYDSFDGLDVLSRFRSANQLERDKKVGAAGELYVSKWCSHNTVFHD